MKSSSYQEPLVVGVLIGPRLLFSLLCTCIFLLALSSEASAYQNRGDRIYISKKKQEPDTTKVSRKVKKEKKEKRPFRLRLGKPEYNGSLSVFRYLPDENTESNINFSGGLEISFDLDRQLQLFGGLNLNYIDQNFMVGNERVQGRLANGALLAKETVSTDVVIFGLEIPMGVRYRLRDAHNSLVIGAGFSTRTSIKERYTDHILWKTGGLVGSNFVASTTRETTLINDSPKAFEFFNIFSSGFLSLGKSFRVGMDRTAEIQLTYHFNMAGTKNIFQEARFKKFESLGITLKYPLFFNRIFKSGSEKFR
ncbi:MAG: hypothetical protein HEP71_12140 [Roseivirga sp.]|nr:hypothetical protein [Roseivirga sp.]